MSASTRDHRSLPGRALLGSILCLLILLPASIATALDVAAGGQAILVPDGSVRRASVSDPGIADVEVVSSRELLVRGKQPGATNLLLWLEGASEPKSLRVTVNPPDLGVPAPFSQQVQISTRIVEMSRRALRQAGINLTRVTNNSAVSISPPGTLSGISRDGATGFIVDSASGFLPISEAFNLVYGNVGEDLLVTVSVLEQNGLAHTLAEPTMVVLSGQTASFLAGGEFPIPVAQNSSNNSITVEFKPFGIRLLVTPTVLDADRISLKVAPEVSEIDFSNVIDTGGIEIPGFLTRRADTTIQLGDGESFAISGLISRKMVASVDKLPGVGDIPILGALFKTTRYEREDRELLMIVSPRLVRPTVANAAEPPLPGEEYENYLPSLGELQGLETGDFDPEGAGFWP